MHFLKSENSASAEAFLATMTKSYRRGCSFNSIFIASRKRRLILFLTTALPIFLLTASPSLLKASPLAIA